jgi:hypothetical protein
MSDSVPQEVIDTIDSQRWTLGQSVRITHVGCSDGKDPALSITRSVCGWLYHCYRCGEASGFISSERCTPEDVLKQVNLLNDEPAYEVVESVQFPSDALSIVNVTANKIELSPTVPSGVFTWLWRYHVSTVMMAKYDLKWSPSYQRLIFPLYDTILLSGGEVGIKLLGWLGRDVVPRTKAERREKKIPKWLTKRNKSSKHFYYHIVSESTSIVIVEDVVSAIRVHEATGFNTLALNTTFLPTKILLRLRPYKTYLWLDGNMLKKMTDYASKCSALGVKVKLIHTTRDPKEYGVVNILNILGGKHE